MMFMFLSRIRGLSRLLFGLGLILGLVPRFLFFGVLVLVGVVLSGLMLLCGGIFLILLLLLGLLLGLFGIGLLIMLLGLSVGLLLLIWIARLGRLLRRFLGSLRVPFAALSCPQVFSWSGLALGFVL